MAVASITATPTLMSRSPTLKTLAISGTQSGTAMTSPRGSSRTASSATAELLWGSVAACIPANSSAAREAGM